MSVTRRDVFEQLATASDAEGRETTTAGEIAAVLDADESTVDTHLDGLVACELARRLADGDVRVTITGNELLELDVEEGVIVDPS